MNNFFGKFRFDKSLGQHFLHDKCVLSRIVSFAGDISGKNILEIGPGFGSITAVLLEHSPKSLVLIEADDRCVAECRGRFPNLNIIHGDALQVNEANTIPSKSKIIANLPYNISVALILKWISMIDFFEDITVLVQKEVGHRILATSGREYGILGLCTAVYCEVYKGPIVLAGSFTPSPKVDGLVVKLRAKTPITHLKIKELIKHTGWLFKSRRKQIGGLIKGKNLKVDGIDGSLRPDRIAPSDMCRIAEISKATLN